MHKDETWPYRFKKDSRHSNERPIKKRFPQYNQWAFRYQTKFSHPAQLVGEASQVLVRFVNHALLPYE